MGLFAGTFDFGVRLPRVILARRLFEDVSKGAPVGDRDESEWN